MSERPWERLLTTDAVLKLHARGLQAYGGREGELHEGCVDAALGNAWSAEHYARAPYPGLSFVAHAMLYLAMRHCFVEGNKRTAWTAGMLALSRLDLTIDATVDEGEEFMGKIMSKEITEGSQIMRWLAPRLREL